MFLTSHLLSKVDGLKHGFWGRVGGVSTGNFGSLNVVRHKGDPDENVFENRKRICTQLDDDKSSGKLCLLTQVHGNRVVQVNEPITHEIEADAMVTKEAGLYLAIRTADCIPLLMVHPKTRTIAAAHAGWRGAIEGIIENTVHAMGVPSNEIIAAIGPCIWQVSYTVGPEVYEQIPNKTFFLPSPTEANKYLFDLPGYAIKQLKSLGIHQISLSPANTYHEKDKFFSYRRATHEQIQSGCQLSVIGW